MQGGGEKGGLSIFHFFKRIWVFFDILQLFDDVDLFERQRRVIPGVNNGMSLTSKAGFERLKNTFTAVL